MVITRSRLEGPGLYEGLHLNGLDPKAVWNEIPERVRAKITLDDFIQMAEAGLRVWRELIKLRLGAEVDQDITNILLRYEEFGRQQEADNADQGIADARFKWLKDQNDRLVEELNSIRANIGGIRADATTFDGPDVFKPEVSE